MSALLVRGRSVKGPFPGILNEWMILSIIFLLTVPIIGGSEVTERSLEQVHLEVISNENMNIVVNEIYPDPDLDINGDGDVNQDDEFIELFNPMNMSVNISGWSISDNSVNHTLPSLSIASGAHFMIPRTLSGIKLGSDDIVTLWGPNGTIIDRFEYNDCRKGTSFQRIPDGDSRWSRMSSPTYKMENPSPPAMIINEIMINPSGSNLGNQWIEILNRGANWSIKEFQLTNHGSINIQFPELFLKENEKILIIIGPRENLPYHPDNVTVLALDIGRTFFSNGDDAELVDHDGYTLDYIAWGNSSHVDLPTGKGEETVWKGKYFDPENDTMTFSGVENIGILEGRSLMRGEDGIDTNSPDDLIYGPSSTGGTPGWNNSIDIGLEVDFKEDELMMNTSSFRIIPAFITRSGNMTGEVIMELSTSDEAWLLDENEMPLTIHEGADEVSFNMTLFSSTSINMSYSTTISVKARWKEMDFIEFEKELLVKIPSSDCELSDVRIELDRFPSEIFPEGSYIRVIGKVLCSGDLDPGDTCLSVSLLSSGSDEIDPPIFREEMGLIDLKKTSQRQFETRIDTLGMNGAFSLEIVLDPHEEIDERHEDNNKYTMPIEIIPTVPGPGMDKIIFTDIRWNCSYEDLAFKFYNPSSAEIDVSHFRINDQDGWIGFPEGAVIPAGTSFIVSSNGAEELQEGVTIKFTTDGSGISKYRMTEGEGSFGGFKKGIVELTTRYRDVIDRVVLKRKSLSGSLSESMVAIFPETTYCSILRRRSDTMGHFVDTNSSLDWIVDPMSSWFSRLMIDPGPDGPGEFIGLNIENVSEPGGLVITRGNGLISIPYGSLMPDRSDLIIASEPDSYQDLQGIGSDLSFSDCRVSGYSSLTLPNNGGIATLLDRGNRVIDSFSWGDQNEKINPGQGDILASYRDDIGTLRWRVAGRGRRPFDPVSIENGSFTIITDVRGIGFEPGSKDRLHVFMAGLIDPDLVGKLIDARVYGTPMDLYVMSPPWTREEPFQSSTTMENEMGYLKKISMEGARIFCLENGGSPFLSTTIFNSTVIWTMDQSRIPERNNPVDGARILEITNWNTHHKNMIGKMNSVISDRKWYDPTPMLKDIAPLYPTPSDKIELVENEVIQIDIEEKKMFWGTNPFIESREGMEITIFQTSGPLDVVYLSSLLAMGFSIDLHLDPGYLSVFDNSIIQKTDEHRDLISGRTHLSSSGPLSEDVGMRAYSLMEEAKKNGWELDVNFLDPGEGMIFEQNFWAWSDHMALEILDGIDDETNCWMELHLNNIDDETLRRITSTMEIPYPIDLFPKQHGSFPAEDNINVVIDRVYFDTYLKDDPEEAFSILNRGNERVDLSYHIITDDEGHGMATDGVMIIPESTILEPGENIWIAREAQQFHSQFGHYPDISIFPDKNVPLTIYMKGDLRLSNSNDSLALRDRNGTMIDLLVYGANYWKNTWNHFPCGFWNGTGLEPPGWGRICQRRSNWEFNVLPDRNDISDWEDLRPIYPGQKPVRRSMVHENVILTGSICPENGIKSIEELIKRSRESISLNVYEFTSDRISTALIGARERGVDIRVLLEGGPVGGRSFTSEVQADRMTEKGISVRWMVNDIQADIRDRYRYDHAKYMVVDSREVLVSTDNLKDSSFPVIDGKGSGTRGWMVSVDSTELASDMLDLFNNDWSGPDMIDNVIDPDLLERYDPPVAKDEGLPDSLLKGNSEDAIIGDAQILVSPDHISVPDNPLMKSILEAKSSIKLELMDISTHFSLHGESISDAELHHWGVKRVGDIENPYLLALIASAKRGVKVEMLLDGSDFNGDGSRDNDHIIEELDPILKELGIHERFVVRTLPTPGGDIDGELNLIHVKGAIIDEKILWISSFNWNPTSAYENREVGLLVNSPELCKYFLTAFDHDLGITMRDDLDLRIMEFYQIPKGSGASFHYRLGVDWMERSTLTISLVSTFDRTEVAIIQSVSGETKTELEGDLTIKEKEIEEGYIIQISDGNRSLYLTKISPSSIDRGDSYQHGSFFTSSWVPIVIILIVLISISLARLVFLEMKEVRKNRSSGRLYEE